MWSNKIMSNQNSLHASKVTDWSQIDDSYFEGASHASLAAMNSLQQHRGGNKKVGAIHRMGSGNDISLNTSTSHHNNFDTLDAAFNRAKGNHVDSLNGTFNKDNSNFSGHVHDASAPRVLSSKSFSSPLFD